MKSVFVRSGMAVAVLAVLAACGGKESFEVRGTIKGMAYPGLELVNNGSETLTFNGSYVATTDVPFAFAKRLDYGQTYDVKIPETTAPNQLTVKKNPLHQNCTVNNGADTAGRLAAIDIIVTCVTNRYTIGGNITGLTTDGLELINGSDSRLTVLKTTPAPVPNTMTFVFPTLVTFGVTYGVSILTQPTGQTCVIDPPANATGTMGDAAVTNIQISCS